MNYRNGYTAEILKQKRAAISKAISAAGGQTNLARQLTEQSAECGEQIYFSRWQVERWRERGGVPGHFVPLVACVSGLAPGELDPLLYRSISVKG